MTIQKLHQCSHQEKKNRIDVLFEVLQPSENKTVVRINWGKEHFGDDPVTKEKC